MTGWLTWRLEKEWPDFWGERFFKACSWSSLSGECDLENGRRFFEQPPFFVSARLRAQNGKLALVDSSSGLARPQGFVLPEAPELTALRKLMSFYHLCVFPNPKFTTAQGRPCVRAISDEGFKHSWRQLHWWSYEPTKDTKCTLLMVEYIFHRHGASISWLPSCECTPGICSKWTWDPVLLFWSLDHI